MHAHQIIIMARAPGARVPPRAAYRATHVHCMHGSTWPGIPGGNDQRSLASGTMSGTLEGSA